MVRFVDTIPDAKRLGAAERAAGIGRTVLHVAEIDSTNRGLIDLGVAGVEIGTVLVADHQTRGRGKGSRAWFSHASGSLCVSVLIRTRRGLAQAPQLTLLGAVALREAIAEQTGIAAHIKWPNDLLVDGRKICGILAEAHCDAAGELDFVVLGFGLNIAIEPADFPEELRDTATSLSTLVGRAVDRVAILNCFLDQLKVWLPLWESHGVSSFAETWTRHAEHLGQIVRITDGDQPTTARLLGLADDGALRILDETGSIRLVHSGDIATGNPVGRGPDDIFKKHTGVISMKTERKWDTLAADTRQRMEAAAKYIGPGKRVKQEDVVALLKTVIRSYDRVNIEGNNQKQADFLADCLYQVDPKEINNLHMVQSCVPLPVHLDMFEKGIAKRLDFAFGGPQAARVAKFISEGKIELGAIHTYLELFGRYFVDLTPRVSLICAYQADREGNLYTGFNTEDTPVIVEATKFRQGIVIAQVNQIVDKLPRVDIPADWVDAVVESPKPFFIEPLFTRDPGLITDSHILLAMLALKGIYGEYKVKRLNHGIGFLTSAIELILPTYGEELGLKGECCTHMVLNPHPTMIPAIEAGWVDTIHCFGGELGMEDYVRARSDVFFTGPDGSMRSNRAFAQTAGHYALDMFIGGTLQIDKFGNSSTATANRVAGFGGAPNMGCDAKGRRHVTESWLKCGQEVPNMHDLIGDMPRGKRLVVQGLETFGEGRAPSFVDKLDAWKLAENAKLDLPPVMIYGDDVTHIVTEDGIAYLNRAPNMEVRMAAIRAVAGYTEVGLKEDPAETKKLREAKIFQTPEDIGIDRSRANRDLLAARSMRDLVDISGGLYNPPTRFRNW